MKLHKKRIIFFVFTVVFLSLAVIQSLIIFYGVSSTPEKSDAIIVLGCQAWGKSPSIILEERLIKAYDLYNSGYGKYIIVSGGQGKDETFSEAEVMKQWLLKKGIPENIILIEDKSTSTYENLRFSKSIMENNRLDSAVIVTSEYHMYRSLMLSGKVGIKASGGPAKTLRYLLPGADLREILSVIKSYITNLGFY
ncbi:MAG TPA: YdcF family protein [Clostridia bacterium]